MKDKFGYIILNFYSEMVKNGHAGKSRFFGLCKSLLMGLGLDHQQHTAKHTGGVSNGRVIGFGCWRWWHVTGDRWQVTLDNWHVTTKKYNKINDFFVLVLLSAHIERFSVSRMHDIYIIIFYIIMRWKESCGGRNSLLLPLFGKYSLHIMFTLYKGNRPCADLIYWG